MASPTLPVAHAPASSKVFRFLDLPGEIRNLIYPLLLDGEDPQTYSEGGYRRDPPGLYPENQIAGLYMPFTHYASGIPDKLGRRKGHTFMHASPPILAVNKQIRREAKTLFLSKFLTLELHSTNKTYGLLSLRQWLNTLGFEETMAIQRVELRERVRIAHPDHVQGAREPYHEDFGTQLGRERYWWGGQIAAIELVIKDDGRQLEVRSRLEIVEREKEPVRDHIAQLAMEKKQGDTFTGADLMALAEWLKVTDEIERPPGPNWDGPEKWYPRWLMLGTTEEIDCSEIDAEEWMQASLWESIKLGFRHLVARAEITN